MNVIGNALLALVRPARGIDGLGAALRWVWAVFLGLLIATVIAKVLVTTPLQLEYESAAVDEMMQADLENASDAERAMIQQEIDNMAALDTGETATIVRTASLIFGSLGAALAVLFTALFFFVAGKTSGSQASVPTMLSVAGLASVPTALRNIVQTITMAASGTWLQHQGLSSLVVPADPSQQPPALIYAFLAQIDLWALWAVLLLVGALGATAVGFTRKRAISTTLIFVTVVVIARMLPQLVSMLIAPGV